MVSSFENVYFVSHKLMRMTKMASLLMMTIDDDDPYGHYDERYDG